MVDDSELAGDIDGHKKLLGQRSTLPLYIIILLSNYSHSLLLHKFCSSRYMRSGLH